MPETSPFYLTRQLANTMEELARRSRNQSAVFCIIGAEGIGKSRLISRFLETRSRKQEGTIFCAKSGGVFIQKGGDGVEVDRIYESMVEHDLVFIDQTEQMDCQQISTLLGHWKRLSLSGKVCMLVLVGRAEAPCAKEMSLQLTSGQLFEFNLKPMSIEESMDFLRFRLGLTDDLDLNLNSSQRSSLKKASGKFDELVRLSDSLAGTVSTRRSIGRSVYALAAGVILALLLFAGVSFAPSLVVESEQTGIATSDFKQETESNTVKTDAESSQEPDQLPPSGILPPANGVAPIEVASEVIVEDQDTDQERLSQVNQQMTFTETETSTERIQLDTQISDDRDILAQRLQATSDFIARSSDNTGTIQLITLVMDELNWDPIADYLDQLKREGINLDNVFVYKRERERQVILGILYGEYDNSSIARTEIQMLPEKLKENSPFPRSVRGIKREIMGG